MSWPPLYEFHASSSCPGMLVQFEELVRVEFEPPCQDFVCLDQIASQDPLFHTKEFETSTCLVLVWLGFVVVWSLYQCYFDWKHWYKDLWYWKMFWKQQPTMLAILRCSRETNTLQHTAASWYLKLDQKKWVKMIEKVWFSHHLPWMKIWIGNYQLIDKW